MGRLIDEDSLKFTNFEIIMCDGDYKQAFKLFCEKLDNAPTIDAEPVRHGHWVKSSEYKGDNISGYTDIHWVCSECGEEAIVNEWYVYDLTDYCPHCGAKMGLKDGE